MNKADAWVVLRFDDSAATLDDRIAVKGVYNSEREADSAVPNAVPGSRYKVVRSRHFFESNRPYVPKRNGLDRVQGLPLQLLDKPVEFMSSDAQFIAMQQLWSELPPDKHKSLVPALSLLTEVSVAKAIGGAVMGDRDAADLRLPNGELVEVRPILLDDGCKKSPYLQLKDEGGFDWLALVLFDPDLQPVVARLIPTEAVKLYGRPVSGSKVSLRVTQSLLEFPGSLEIGGIG